MPSTRKVKQFAVYVRLHYTVVQGGQTSYVYYAGSVADAQYGAQDRNVMNGEGDDYWKLIQESDSLDEALGVVREQLALGHALSRIKLDHRVILDEKFNLVV